MFSIDKGVSIIEASAGTGKTYTLCRIVLKLIVEKGIPIDRILAITFTQAATEELISRIRELLHDSISQLDSGEIGDLALKELIEQQGIGSNVARNRLRHSLEIFDDASISTIHGFCKRSLDFVSLESDIALEANLEPVDGDLIERLQDEYVRINILEKSPLLSAFYIQTTAYKKRLNTIAKECASHPYALLEPKPTEAHVDQLEVLFDLLLDSITPLLESVDTFLNHLKKGGKFYKRLSTQTGINALEALRNRRFALLSDLKLLSELNTANWSSSLKKSAEHLEPPPFSKHVDNLLIETDQIFTVLVSRYRDWLFDNLRAEKERRNVVSFNDLLHVLNRALNDDQGDAVVQAINRQFDAALVDEFQDTDPTQYHIIERLFGDGSKYLFFIGDPKQAIYRFRGADIFSYFNATESKSLQRIQLSENFRSSPKLVQAVNVLFSESPDGFAFEKIQFQAASPARSSSTNIPLQIEAIGLDKPNPLGQKGAINLLASNAAEDLAQRAIDHPQLKLGDVAFLVGTNREADALLKQLAIRGIDCVLRAERSVFETKELDLMLQLVETLSNPSRRSTIRALLLTPIGGYHWHDLLDPNFDEKSQEIVGYLHEWSREWRSSNFDSAFHRLLNLTRANERMLGRLNGDRQYANLCQLSELLQSEALTRLSTPKHLYAWLLGKKDESVSNQEDWQTRLISDEGKPQIVTIHKSKGLQFPIVICPFLSLLRPKVKREHALYHSSGQHQRLVIDLAPEKNSDALGRAENEEYAEHLRLIYVALTRATDECRIYLAPEESEPRQNTRPSSFCQLILGNEKSVTLHSQKNISPSLLQRIQEFDSSCIEVNPRPLTEGEDLSISLFHNSENQEFKPNALPVNRSSIPAAERILSFSTIARMTHTTDLVIEEVGNDEMEIKENVQAFDLITDPKPEPDGPNIFKLPKGAHTGNLFHSILEEIDFQKPDTISDRVQQSFNRLRYGYPEYKRIVSHSIHQLLSKLLDGVIALEQIAPIQRVPEMEFAYPTSNDTLHKIQKALENNPTPGIPRTWIDTLMLKHTNVRTSMLRGFIDLVFEHSGKLFLLDWKTNHLGNSVESYSQRAIEHAMFQHDYYLQYCLYCVALKRYIETRFPNKDFYDSFGGVFYLFIRGINEHDDSGIFYDRPSKPLLKALDKAIGQ